MCMFTYVFIKLQMATWISIKFIILIFCENFFFFSVMWLSIFGILHAVFSILVGIPFYKRNIQTSKFFFSLRKFDHFYIAFAIWFLFVGIRYTLLDIWYSLFLVSFEKLNAIFNTV